MAIEQTVRSGKAVGTRDRVLGWLAAHGDVEDASGMASTALARSIGYPGSSIAFAQLLSGMERSGLIERAVRGKRTYRVSLTGPGRERARGGPPAPRRKSTRHRFPESRENPGRAVSRRPGAHEDGVDYDELAQRLLYQVAQRLAGDQSRLAARQSATSAGAGGPVDDLEQRLTVLELELAKARAARLALQEENDELRLQLERTRTNLEGEMRRPSRPRSTPPAEQIDHRDIALLQELLGERKGSNRRRDKADSA